MKSLSLGLLLTMAAVTHAGFSIEADDTNLAMGQETTIRLYGGPNETGHLYLIVEWGFQSFLKDPVPYPSLGSLGSVTPYTLPGWTESGYQIIIADLAVLPGGLLAEFTFVTMDVADIVVSLYSNGFGLEPPVDSLTLRESPEPATLALLSLGAIALRRKRR